MCTIRFTAFFAGALLSWSTPAFAQEKLSANSDSDQAGVTVMQRGPVHEAFAQPSNSRPEPAQVVPNKPPAPITEVAPDQKPKGDDVIWIPGYWGWDMEKKDFLWVSGTWRVPPPERKWVPGYWHEAEEGWQWVSGFWAPQKKDAMTYVDRPPATLDNGANSPAPDSDSSWVPGMWIWRDGAWVWRPGFWNSNYAGWIYNPPSYSWTPYGCVYNGGYWDYTLEDRGLLFAPVCFGGGFGGSYTPDCVVGIGGLFGNLWFGCGGYWFGNCYGPFWRACGFQPWCFHGPRCGDALWAHQAWANRGNPNWAANGRNNFLAMQNGKVAGPATTFNGHHGHNAGSHVASSGGANGVGHTGNHHLVTPLNQLGNRATLTRASTEQLNQARHSANTLRQASSARGWNEGTQASMHGSGGGNTFHMPAQLVTNADTGTRGLGQGMNAAHANMGAGARIYNGSTYSNAAQPHANTGANYHPGVNANAYRSAAGASGYHPAPSTSAYRSAPASAGSAPRVSSFSSAGRGTSSGYHGGGGHAGGGHGGGGGRGGGRH